MIEVRDLSVGHDGVAILEGLDFTVRRGQVFLVLGGSGCGKTTLMRTLIGLDSALGGEVRLDTRRASEDGPPPFGVVFQSAALFGSMTLGENLALPLERWTDLDREGIETLVRAKLALVGLGGFEDHLPAQLSGGMRKRAGIARALALEPELVFLDEPGAGLDPITAAELDELILTLSRSLGATVVIVTHELASIFAVGDECILLDRGARGIIARGPPRELRDGSDDPRVRAFLRREAAPSAGRSSGGGSAGGGAA